MSEFELAKLQCSMRAKLKCDQHQTKHQTLSLRKEKWLQWLTFVSVVSVNDCNDFEVSKPKVKMIVVIVSTSVRVQWLSWLIFTNTSYEVLTGHTFWCYRRTYTCDDCV